VIGNPRLHAATPVPYRCSGMILGTRFTACLPGKTDNGIDFLPSLKEGDS
jgi:hypothetical protein